MEPEQVIMPIVIASIFASLVGLLFVSYRNVDKNSELRNYQRRRWETLKAKRGKAYAAVLEREGELPAEIFYLAQQHDLIIGNKSRVDDSCAMLAVDDRAQYLLTAGYYFTGDTGLYKVVSKVIHASEIVSVEQETHVRRTTSGSGLGLPVSVGGMDVSLFLSGRSTTTRVENVYLKLLVRDVKQPWIVISMPDVTTAETWRGIVTLMMNDGITKPTATAESNTQETVLPPRGSESLSRDDLLPLPTAVVQRAAKQ